MPFVKNQGVRIYYRLDGDPELPVLVLGHALGLDHGMWQQQVGDLLTHFQVLRYDMRGHGASDVPAGDYTIDILGSDVAALTDALGIDRFAFCGLSLGGMVGQWLAIHAPSRLTAVVLANTTARLTDPSIMEARRRAVLEGGMGAVTEAALGRFLTPLPADGSAAARPDRSAALAYARRTLLATDPAGYAACCAAVRDMDQTGRLAVVQVPALLISGDRDVSMPWQDHGAVLARLLPHARVVRLPAAHLSNLEAPRAFIDALFDALIPAPADTLESGMVVRRAVLGEAHVDRAMAGATALTREFQTLVTRYAWGTIWTRPGLDHRTRRLLVLASTAAMGRWDEYRLHVRAALAHGIEPCDIREVLLQLAVYAGVPAANTAFHIAREEQGDE